MERDWNAPRLPEGDGGHYESWFLRANHPTRPLAVWIRYTLFRPEGRADATRGERWAIWFDGEKKTTVSLKDDVAWSDVELHPGRLEHRLADASLGHDGATGTLQQGDQSITWHLLLEGDAAPALLFPRALYDTKLPRAKVVTPRPNVLFDGALIVNGEAIEVQGWPGSQNHNWGSRHTDAYCWGQVCGFDDAPRVFLEAATAQVKVGPVLSPRLTPVVLRLEDTELSFNRPLTLFRASAEVTPGRWHFETSQDGASLRCTFSAADDAFVRLSYDNPPGGTKQCLNSKLARCELELTRPGQPIRRLVSAHRAAFEVLS